ncbi:MAG: exodeoxyribonuclease III [Acidimicrobiales bacterium]
MRIATWNVNSLAARMPRVLGWIQEHQPDVLCMQETKQSDDAFSSAEFEALGYESAHHGDGRWNGVALVSRVGLTDVVKGFGSAQDAHGCRMVAATCGGVRVHSLYVPNGRSLEHEQYAFKLGWLASMASYLSDNCDPQGSVALCGDFNIAPDDRDLWDPAVYVGATHASEPERRALRAIMDWGLQDVYRAHHDQGGVFSWWDYRAGDFHQGRGMRIDLILMTESLASKTTEVRIDRDARKGHKPSDHAPVVADLQT